MSLNLAVIESRWWRQGNSSVRGLFDVLADIHEDNPATYHYKMFNNRASLNEIIRRTAKRYLNIYIGAHGNDQSILGAEGRRENNISRTEFRNILRGGMGQKSARLRGVFVGSCMFVNENNAHFLLDQNEKNMPRVRWISGYSKKVDFIDSSVVDLFFWNAYYNSERNGVVRKIREVAQRVDTFMPSANSELGFNIFIKGNQGVVPLLPAE